MRTLPQARPVYALLCASILSLLGACAAESPTATAPAPNIVALHIGPAGWTGSSVNVVLGTDLPFVAERVTADSVWMGRASGVAWSTSNALVATVNASGVVHSVGSGTASITATAIEGERTAQGKTPFVVAVLVSASRL